MRSSRFRIRHTAALITLVALWFVARPAAATSWPKLSPQEIVNKASLVAVGRIAQSLPARFTGGNSIVNGMVMDVEAYLGSRSGPPQLHIALPGGAVSQGTNSMAIPGIPGDKLVGQRLLVLMEPRYDGVGVTPVVGPNGIVPLAASGWSARLSPDAAEKERAEQNTWTRYLEATPRLSPDPAAPAMLMPPPHPLPPQERRTEPLWWGFASTAAAAVATAGYVWHRRRRRI